MLSYNIITEDKNGEEYIDEVYSTIKLNFQLGEFIHAFNGLPERWIRSFSVKVDKIYEEKTQEE